MNTPTSCVPISLLLNVWFVYQCILLSVVFQLSMTSQQRTTNLAAPSTYQLSSGGSVGPLPGITPGEIKAGSHLEYLGKNGTQFPVVMGLKVLFPRSLWARCCLDPQGHLHLRGLLTLQQSTVQQNLFMLQLHLSFLPPTKESSLLLRAFVRSGVPGDISNRTTGGGGYISSQSQVWRLEVMDSLVRGSFRILSTNVFPSFHH